MQYLVSVLPDLLRVPLWRWLKIVAEEVMSGRYYVSLADNCWKRRSHFRKHSSSTAGGGGGGGGGRGTVPIRVDHHYHYLATGGSSVSYSVHLRTVSNGKSYNFHSVS